MLRLFMSYTETDQSAVAALVDVLSAGGIECWRDLTVSWDKLRDVIASCDGLLFALTPDSAKSEACQWYLEQATALYKPVVVALLQKNVTVPAQLSNHMIVNLADGLTPHNVARLIGGLQAVPARQDAPPTVPSRRSRKIKESRAKKPPSSSQSMRAQLLFERARSRPHHEVEERIADYSEAIRLDPRFAEAYARRGATKSLKGDYEGALADYNEAIRLDSSLGLAYLNRGIAREDRNDSEGALADYTIAINLDTEYTDAYFSRGNLRYNRREYERAIEDYEAVLRLNPRHAGAYFNRGNAREKLHDLPSAVSDWQQYLDLDGGRRNGNQEQVEKRIADTKKRMR